MFVSKPFCTHMEVLFPRADLALIANGIVYGPVVIIVNFSILLLYVRILAVNRAIKYLIYFSIAFQIVFYLAYFAVHLALEGLRISILFLGTRYCSCNWKFVLVLGAINIATDLYVLYLRTTMIMHKNPCYSHDRIPVSLAHIYRMSIFCPRFDPR